MSPRGTVRVALGLACGALVVVSTACSKKQDVVVAAADRVSVTTADIDADPVALLPANAVGVVRLDATALFQSQFGPELARIAQARLPLPPSAGFDPSRDLTALVVGFYSMQGADVAAVAIGTFDPDAIEHAADGTTVTPLGAPLVKTTYAKRTLYVSRNVGFSVLTTHTAVFGDETGIRRLLDRLSEGRAKHDLPAWVDDVLKTPNAATASALDLVGQAPVSAAVKGLAFLQGLKTARVVGNFQSPGMNFAGSLGYPTPEAAQAASAKLNQSNQILQSYSFFMQLAGIGNPIQSLQTSVSGSDCQFVAGIDGRAIDWAMGQLATLQFPVQGSSHQ